MVVKKQVKWLKEKKENPPTNVIIYLQLIKKIVYIERGNRSNCATAYMKRP